MNVTSCKLCKASIVFVQSEVSDKKMPLDSPPKKGVVLVVKATGPGASDETFARVVDVYTPHHVTCPEADQFRKRKAKAAANG